MGRGFTLIELLVVIAIVAVVLAILVPTLASAREAGRAAVCLVNQRQIAMIQVMYAQDHRGEGPALGRPWNTPPNWALIVQAASGIAGESDRELYTERSILACPSARAALGRAMQRTYAVNVTGQAGLPGDMANFDDETWTTREYGQPARFARVRLDRIEAPDRRVMLLDSRVAAPPVGDAPPPTRTASAIDFRQFEAHVRPRQGPWHGSRRRIQAAMYDQSAKVIPMMNEPGDVPADWLYPLP